MSDIFGRASGKEKDYYFIVGDIVGIRDQFDHHSFYEVSAVCLGGTGQENLLKLIPLSRKPGVDVDDNEVDDMYVPEVLVDLRSVYRRLIPISDGNSTI